MMKKKVRTKKHVSSVQVGIEIYTRHILMLLRYRLCLGCRLFQNRVL